MKTDSAIIKGMTFIRDYYEQEMHDMHKHCLEHRYLAADTDDDIMKGVYGAIAEVFDKKSDRAYWQMKRAEEMLENM